MTSFPLLEIEKGQEFWEKEGSSGEKYKGGWLLQEKRKIVSSDAEKFFSISLHTNACEHFFSIQPHSARILHSPWCVGLTMIFETHFSQLH